MLGFSVLDYWNFKVDGFLSTLRLVCYFLANWFFIKKVRRIVIEVWVQRGLERVFLIGNRKIS